MNNDIIQKIKDKTNTFEIIQLFSSLELKKEGVNYKASCPFHDEKTASFIVSPAKNRYKCFGCGASGNGIDFIMQYKGLSFIETIQALAKHYGIDTGEKSGIELKVIREKIKHEKPLNAEELKALKIAEEKKIKNQIYYLEKNGKEEAKKYLQLRKINTDLLPASAYYQSNKYTSKSGIEFPVSIAFLDNTKTFINKRFIGNLPENIGKSRNTGNMKNKVYTQTFISKSEKVFVTEGVINAMSYFTLGHSAIATFATSNEFTDFSGLKKYLSGKKIIIAFDNDKAGLNYIVKFTNFLYENEKDIKFHSIRAFLPAGSEDANDRLQSDSLSTELKKTTNYYALTKNFVNRLIKEQKQALLNGIKDYEPVFEHINLIFPGNAKEKIKQKNLAYLITQLIEKPRFENTVIFNQDYADELFKLKSLTKNLVIKFNFYSINDNNKEIPIITTCKKLTANGFNIKIIVGDENYEISFIEFYIDRLASDVPIGDTLAKTEAIKKAASFMAMLDTSVYTVEYARVYKRFGLNKADWNSIAKEYLSKEKHKKIYGSVENEGPNIAELSDPHNLPAYVDVNDFYRKGYFAAQDKEGKEIFYMFRSKDDGLFMASNFTMKMIGHIYHNERPKNKRILKITDEYADEYFMEIESSTIRSFNDFSNRIYEEGNLFFFGSKKQYEMLLKNVSNNIPKWIELEILGQSLNGFFAFADGIYDYKNRKFLSIDDLGTVRYENKTYYIPVFSSIYNKINGHDERFDSAKFLRYDKSSLRKAKFDHTSFFKWSKMMHDVFKEDNAGMFAVIFTIMSAFRDFIYRQHRRFPLFFLSGPTNSGKSQLADSIQAPFAYGMQIYNLNSGTDAAFFVSLEKYRNVPMIFDEYNDIQISKIKFQGLKAGYDGVGKQKKKGVDSMELDMSEVNCSIIYLGQEIPEQDDYALFNRSISFFIPLKDYSREETERFDELKKAEEKGLTNILIEILNQRKYIEKYYYKYQIQIKDTLKKELQENNEKYIERILNSISEYLAVFKIMIEFSELEFAFDYETFYWAAKEKCIRLSEMVQNANRLAVFFQTITYLFNIGKITAGKEFKIEKRKSIKIRINQNETKDIVFENERNLIFIRVNLIFPMYRDIQKNESLKTSLLNTYLKDSPAWVGSAINEDFEWYERKILQKDNQVGDKYVTEEYVASKIRNTTAIALDYDMLDLDLQKVIAGNEEETNKYELPF